MLDPVPEDRGTTRVVVAISLGLLALGLGARLARPFAKPWMICRF